jgi:hypothetical protein
MYLGSGSTLHLGSFASLKATEGGELKSNRKALVLQFCTD